MRKKLKLLIIADYFTPHWTGFAKAVQNFVQGTKDVYDITVLTVKHDRALLKEEELNGARVLREDYIFPISRSKYSIAIIFKFFSEAKNTNVVLINSPCSNILPFTIMAKIFGKKVYIFHHGDLILPGGVKNRIIEYFFDLSSYLSYFLADSILTYTLDYAENSRTMRGFLAKFHPVMMPIYLSKKTKETVAFKKIKLLKEKGYKILGFAGRFVEEKGFDVLFNAILKVSLENKKVIFIYAGETKMGYEDFYRKTVNKIKKVEKNVIFLGLLNQEEMRSFYKLIDYIIVPSRSDCFPLVQAEAMLSGVPSIVSDIPGARFLVKETGFGFIFAKEDQNDLSGRILEAIKNRRKILKYKDKIRKIFNNSKNVKEIQNIIR